MTVEILGSVAQNNSSSTAGLSVNHTLLAGQNRLMVFGVELVGNSVNIDLSAWTYGGVSITEIDQAKYTSDQTVRAYLGYIKEDDLPADGVNSYHFACAPFNAKPGTMQAVCLQNVDQLAPITQFAEGGAESSSWGVSVPLAEIGTGGATVIWGGSRTGLIANAGPDTEYQYIYTNLAFHFEAEGLEQSWGVGTTPSAAHPIGVVVAEIAAGDGIYPPHGEVIVTGYAPEVILDNTMYPPVGSLVVTGYAPTFVTTLDMWFRPPTGAVSVTGYEVQAGADNILLRDSDGNLLNTITAGDGVIAISDGTSWRTFELTDEHAGSETPASASYIETGTYVGDGTVSQVVSLTDTELVVKYVRIWERATISTRIALYETTDTIVDDNAAGIAVLYLDGGGQIATTDLNKIIALATGSFTVDDAGADADPNKNEVIYNYYVTGTH